MSTLKRHLCDRFAGYVWLALAFLALGDTMSQPAAAAVERFSVPQGTRVRWGGILVGVTASDQFRPALRARIRALVPDGGDWRLLEIEGFALDARGRPHTELSPAGRFTALTDPSGVASLRLGEQLTITGIAVAMLTLPSGHDRPVRLPIVRSEYREQWPPMQRAPARWYARAADGYAPSALLWIPLLTTAAVLSDHVWISAGFGHRYRSHPYWGVHLSRGWRRHHRYHH